MGSEHSHERVRGQCGRVMASLSATLLLAGMAVSGEASPRALSPGRSGGGGAEGERARVRALELMRSVSPFATRKLTVTSVEKCRQGNDDLWKVIFSDGTEVFVSHTPKQEVAYFWGTGPLPREPKPEDFAFRKDSAIARAKAALREKGADLSQLRLSGAHFSPSLRNWTVTFQRMLGEMPYRGQGAGVTVSAEMGRINGCEVDFPTPPPAMVPEPAGAGAVERAKQKARRTLEAAGVVPGGDTFVKTEIVRPNASWKRREADGPLQHNLLGELEKAEHAVVALVCKTVDEKGNFFEVWIHAVNGEVVGGSWIGTRRLPKPPAVTAEPPNR